MAKGRAEEWRQRFADARSSGIAVSEMARRYGVSRASVYYWHQRLQLRSKPEAPACKDVQFVRVEREGRARLPRASSADGGGDAPALFVVWGSARMEVASLAGVPLAAALLQALERSAP